MSTHSPIQPGERSVLYMLAIGALSEKTGSDAETAEEQLDNYPMTLSGDDHHVTLEVNGEILVRAPRAWLTKRDGYQS